jgi:hypothetical protein
MDVLKHKTLEPLVEDALTVAAVSLKGETESTPLDTYRRLENGISIRITRKILLQMFEVR